MKKMLSILLAGILMLCNAIPAFAATADTAAYGHNWHDDATGLTHVQLYEHDPVQNAMWISDRVAIEGSKLYDMAGNLVCNDLQTWADNKPTVAFTTGGMYFVSKDGELRKMVHSTDQTYATCEFTTSYIELDVEDLALNARSGKVAKAISELKFTGSNKRKDDPAVTKGAYVKSQSVEGDPEKIAYLAYSKDKLLLTTYCRASNVWQQDYSKLLSSTCKGAKFSGYLGDYTIMLYDMSKTVYAFKYADGFSKAYKVLQDETVYQFKRSDAGFVTEIVTNKGTHDVSKPVTVPTQPVPVQPTPGDGNNDSVTSVRNFTSKAMAFNGSNLVGSLVKENGTLTWKGTILANSKDPEDFGVTKNGEPVWYLSNGYAYAYQNGACTLVAKDTAQMIFDDAGRVKAIKTTGNKTIEF